jgi:hypothetical protein
MRPDLKDNATQAKPAIDPVAGRTCHAREAIGLLDQWLADESGYDERVWPAVKKGLEENRLSDRSRFRG